MTAGEHYDPAARIQRLLDRVEPQLRRAYFLMLAQIRSSAALRNVERLLEEGRMDEAVALVRANASLVAGAWTTAYVLSGREAAEFLGSKLEVAVSFDQANEFAVAAMRRNQLRLVREISEGQRQAWTEVILDGIQRGLNPREIARQFRESVGLTAYQERIISNYRRQLEQLDSRLLSRELRDRRFDPTVVRSIEEGSALSGAQVDRMVERYRQRWVAYRAEVIARTEALRSVHEGTDEMYRQAVEQGLIDPASIEQKWNPARDARVRDSHQAMRGQVRPLGQPFLSGLGNLLRYPGDSAAPLADTAQCRCAVSRRFVALPQLATGPTAATVLRAG